MARLGLSEKLLEQEGLDLSGRDETYYESSAPGSPAKRFDHTEGGRNDHRHVPITDNPNPVDQVQDARGEFLQSLGRNVEQAKTAIRNTVNNLVDSVRQSEFGQRVQEGYERFRQSVDEGVEDATGATQAAVGDLDRSMQHAQVLQRDDPEAAAEQSGLTNSLASFRANATAGAKIAKEAIVTAATKLTDNLQEAGQYVGEKFREGVAQARAAISDAAAVAGEKLDAAGQYLKEKGVAAADRILGNPQPEQSAKAAPVCAAPQPETAAPIRKAGFDAALFAVAALGHGLTDEWSLRATEENGNPDRLTTEGTAPGKEQTAKNDGEPAPEEDRWEPEPM